MFRKWLFNDDIYMWKIELSHWTNIGAFVYLLQILGTGMDTQDTSPSVLLFFDKQRFIFNAGEVSLGWHIPYQLNILCLSFGIGS